MGLKFAGRARGRWFTRFVRLGFVPLLSSMLLDRSFGDLAAGLFDG
jgi:hypothetical protein